ncbi:MAG: adenylate kinase [Dehalococcoidia bacterium]|nr:adenylate kinase [Dehalococcoidia bacterium]
MMSIDSKIAVFLGAPGVGKGTQAALVAQQMQMSHLSSGDLFRQAVERGDELGKQVKAIMESGALVPDEITTQMVLDRLSQSSSARGVILDGFPRNIVQAESLDKALTEKQGRKVDVAVCIDVAQEELIRRLSLRWLCRKCQTPYNRDAEDVTPLVCEKCGGELYQRADDAPDTVLKRLQVYFAATMPLIEYYKQCGILIEVDGGGSVESITARIVLAMGGSR